MKRKKIMREKRVSVGRGKYRINLSAIITKDGLIVSILGVEKPHAGAVAIGIPRYSLNDPSKISVTTSVFTMIGHKDDEVAKPVAQRLAKDLNQTAVVVVGMHIEKAKEEDIRKLVNNSMQAVEVFLRKTKNDSMTFD